MQQEIKKAKCPHGLLLLFAITVAALITFVVYPGVLYSDSYGRAEYAATILYGEWPENFVPYITMLPSIYIALFLWLTNSYAVYTWVQASFFLWSLLEMLWKVYKGRSAAVVLTFLAFSPLWIGYAVYWETGVLTAILLMWLICVDEKIEKSSSKMIVLLLLLVYAFVCFTITGYRINAATAIVGILAWNGIEILRKKQKVRQTIAKVMAAMLGIVLALQIPHFLGLPNTNNAMTGVLWETCSIVNRIGPGKGYDQYMDSVIGPGNTERLFDVEEPESSMYQFSDVFDYWSLVMNNPDEIAEKYIKLVLEKPGVFVNVKAKIVWKTLTEANFKEYLPNPGGGMNKFDVLDTVRRDRTIEIVNQYMNLKVISVLRIPLVMFGLALLLSLTCFHLHLPTERLFQMIFVALCYEGGYFITTQAYEFRYFFPAWLLLFFTILLAAREIWEAKVSKQYPVLEYGISKKGNIA